MDDDEQRDRLAAIEKLQDQAKQAHNLSDAEVIYKLVSPDTKLISIVFIIPTERLPVAELVSAGNLSVTQWEGLVEFGIDVAYLSHNGTNLRCQTATELIFDAPIKQVTADQHALGISLRFNGKRYLIGNPIAVTQPISYTFESIPKESHSFFGNAMTPWIEELMNFGVIKRPKKSKRPRKYDTPLIVAWAVAITVALLAIFLLT